MEERAILRCVRGEVQPGPVGGIQVALYSLGSVHRVSNAVIANRIFWIATAFVMKHREGRNAPLAPAQ